MNILRKILSILFKVVVGIFAFYLFCSWIVIPLVAPWVIKSQGTKVLNHRVQVRGVGFNPFLWKVNVDGFQIVDDSKNKLIGFDRLVVDVSFLKLVNKVYYVEAIRLDGLFIEATLLPSGQINLLGLIPSESKGTDKAATKKEEQSQPLPLVTINEIVLNNGQVVFNDQNIAPGFKTVIGHINIHLNGFSTQKDSVTKFDFKAKLDEKGVLESQAQLKPFSDPLEMDLTFGLNDYALTVLGPYSGKYTARGLKDGKLDIKVSYRISAHQLTASHKFLIQKFDFGDKVESKDALKLPFGLFIALLEDPQGRINIALPAKGDMSDPKFEYTHLIWQVLRNFFVKLMTKPFAILASAIGSDSGTEEIGYIRFTPGGQDLLTEEVQKLTLLARGLNERPKILLEINGSYDPTVDWKAIKIETLQKDYKVLKGESTKKEDWVYDSLYQRRFGIRELWRLNKSFRRQEGGYDGEKKNAEIRRRLIEDAPPDKVALEFLAQSRAKTVYDGIIKAGLDPKRVRIGNPHEGQASMGFVPLEFTLTVFEEASHGT